MVQWKCRPRPSEDFLDGWLLRSLRCLTVKADGVWWTEFIVSSVIQSSLMCNQFHSALKHCVSAISWPVPEKINTVKHFRLWQLTEMSSAPWQGYGNVIFLFFFLFSHYQAAAIISNHSAMNTAKKKKIPELIWSWLAQSGNQSNQFLILNFLLWNHLGNHPSDPNTTVWICESFWCA